MTSPEFWLTVLSSVIGAGIGAAIAYYLGNRQIKKQISESRRIVEVQFKLNILTASVERLNAIYSNDFFKWQLEKGEIISTPESKNLTAYLYVSAQYLTSIRQVIISVEKYINNGENKKQINLLKQTLKEDHDYMISAAVKYRQGEVSIEEIFRYYDHIFELVNEKITNAQGIIRKEEEILLKSLR